jgi:hypothetical protein
MLFAALAGGGPRFTFECYASRENEPRISKAVSQLLAGSPSGPGRSPGAARVPDLHSQARGRHTSSRCHERLAKSAPQTDEVTQILREL